jgi:hypothetical protein
VAVKLDLGRIEVAGSVQTSSSTENKRNSDIKKPLSVKDTKIEKEIDLTPVYSLKNNYIYQKRNITLFIGFVLICFLGIRLKDLWSRYKIRDLNIIEEIRKQGLSYGKLHELLTLLADKTTMRENVEESNLSDKSKKELINIISNAENLYSQGKKDFKLKIKSKVLNEIGKILKEKNEA